MKCCAVRIYRIFYLTRKLRSSYVNIDLELDNFMILYNKYFLLLIHCLCLYIATLEIIKIGLLIKILKQNKKYLHFFQFSVCKSYIIKENVMYIIALTYPSECLQKSKEVNYIWAFLFTLL